MKVRAMDGVHLVKFDMCEYGLIIEDGPVQKRTAVMTNSPEAAKRLGRQCRNRGNGPGGHKHTPLEGGGRCKQAQVYPRDFCRAVCESVAAQRQADMMNVVLMDIMQLEEINAIGGDDLHEPEMDMSEYTATDDVTGAPLDPAKVAKARAEEMEYFRNMNVYEYTTVEECKRITGKPPVGVRWIDINKGDDTLPNYRSRLVAKEFRVDVQPEYFAATPPVECMRLLLSRAASDDTLKVLYLDVSRADFYAKSIRPTFVKLPSEDPKSKDPNVCGRLIMTMYGTRDAALNWAEAYTATLTELGYTRGIANPCLYYNHKTKVSILVHGDYFVGVGCSKDIYKLQAGLAKVYKSKSDVIGLDAGKKARSSDTEQGDSERPRRLPYRS